MLNNDYNGFSFFSTRFLGKITLYSNFKWPEYVKGPLTKDVRLTPEEGVCGIRTFNCYSNMILLLYPDAWGGVGSRNPGFTRTSFVSGPFSQAYTYRTSMYLERKPQRGRDWWITTAEFAATLIYG